MQPEDVHSLKSESKELEVNNNVQNKLQANNQHTPDKSIISYEHQEKYSWTLQPLKSLSRKDIARSPVVTTLNYTNSHYFTSYQFF